jgi:hypothetical protein
VTADVRSFVLAGVLASNISSLPTSCVRRRAKLHPRKMLLAHLLDPLRRSIRGPHANRGEASFQPALAPVTPTHILPLSIGQHHIVNRKSGSFEPEKFEDHYETALLELINQKRVGKPITPKETPKGENVVDLMGALRRSVGGRAAETTAQSPSKAAKKPRKAAAGHADADRGKKAGRGSACKEIRGQAATPVRSGIEGFWTRLLGQSWEVAMDLKQASAMTWRPQAFR